MDGFGLLDRDDHRGPLSNCGNINRYRTEVKGANVASGEIWTTTGSTHGLVREDGSFLGGVHT